MALGVQRMAKLHAIVRKLPSVETVGSVTVICSDKTGTLTEGKMGAQQIWSSDNSNYIISHSTSLDPNEGEIMATSSTSLEVAIKTNTLSATHPPRPIGKAIEKMPGPLVLTLLVSSLCNNSGINKADDGSFKSVGDPTEVALLVAGIKGGVTREWSNQSAGLVKLGEFAFDSDRKLMSSLYSASESSPPSIPSDACFVFVKGAPEAVIRCCTRYLVSSDDRGLEFLGDSPSVPLTDEYVELLSTQSAQMASCGLRVLAMAVKRISTGEGSRIFKSQKHSEAESELSFVGIVGLIDPPKPGVKESIALSKSAGIQIIMITGDHLATATAIAKDLGIITDNSNERRTMQGYEIDLLSEETLSLQRPFPVVFARVSPDNKLKIVKALQRIGHSVVMTGDGGLHFII